jgi:ABC-2 type transport system ATP-binding protein
MVEKRVQCPSCHTAFTLQGEPGSTKTVTCPRCGTKGTVTFHAIQQRGELAIEVRNLRKIYNNVAAVNGISFVVKKGEIFAFLGPNGAGKTTTVEMIESIRQPSQGTIRLLGADIRTDFDRVKEKIGILPQEFHSFERFTVRETLIYFSKLYEKRANIDDVLKAMDLLNDQHKLYRNLSGGLKQRVGVAVSLVNDPEVVFLDEPTTGLDPKARREVWEVIEGLRNKGKTVFLTTHYMEEAEYLADHIAIIHKGNIIAEGTLQQLVAHHGEGTILRIKSCRSRDFIHFLQEQGYHAKEEGNGDIAITIDYKERVLDVLSLLRHECVDYDSIDIRQSNLEEIFLKLTGARLSGGIT